VHELSIAGAIVDVAARHAGGRRVRAVEVRIGHLRQVVPSALAFAWELVAAGGPVEGAELRIEPVAAAGDCRGCGVRSELHGFPLRCAACGGLDLKVVRGEELLVEWLELDDEAVASGPAARQGGRRT
jgi:hydrogenase nickel incorporation protein HypA/HybF